MIMIIRKIILIILIIFSIKGLSQNSYLIGDSQTFYISKNTKNVELYKPLTQPGIGISKLNNKFKSVPINYKINNVFVCIGANDSYNDLGINRLKSNLKKHFPNSKFYAIKGSWGWGNVNRINFEKYESYYKKFDFPILKHNIGKGDPHKNKESYKLIGKEIESIVKGHE